MINPWNFLEIEYNDFDELEIENAQILMKYEGYIKREKEVADKLMRLENIKIYKDIALS